MSPTPPRAKAPALEREALRNLVGPPLGPDWDRARAGIWLLRALATLRGVWGALMALICSALGTFEAGFNCARGLALLGQGQSLSGWGALFFGALLFGTLFWWVLASLDNPDHWRRMGCAIFIGLFGVGAGAWAPSHGVELSIPAQFFGFALLAGLVALSLGAIMLASLLEDACQAALFRARELWESHLRSAGAELPHTPYLIPGFLPGETHVAIIRDKLNPNFVMAPNALASFVLDAASRGCAHKPPEGTERMGEADLEALAQAWAPLALRSLREREAIASHIPPLGASRRARL